LRPSSPGLAVETKFAIAVAPRFAVEIKEAKFAVETTPWKLTLDKPPPDPRPITVDVS
jgi:hypothetical protein